MCSTIMRTLGDSLYYSLTQIHSFKNIQVQNGSHCRDEKMASKLNERARRDADILADASIGWTTILKLLVTWRSVSRYLNAISRNM